ncbi:polysaccharide lyase family 8 super-sandwich domain-containing protein [Streptomyces hoynatensis]|uniref:Silent information regulator protein Sir2 n=1 Tax=Streptomyces hoynatensis TaxID=1141874 RepID=A0A3A9YQ88_9ACTN|nr:polysaccharide lyase family 8 super-sandwich domain-containing protein [Streptomyces hoynatensis]RKN38145.1 silent information regulator protein Sir2 [Streptomyces hoynatensis]
MGDLETIRARVRQEIREAAADPPRAARLARSQSAEGTWPDIDYADGEGAEYPPLEHLSRALCLACSAPYLAEGLAALAAWSHLAPRSDNWWFNEIGAPRLAGDALLLLREGLGTEERAAWGTWLAQTAGSTEMTGQNLVWSQSIVLRRGLLVDDGELVASAVRRMSEVLTLTEREGIQSDFSFHQHGAQLYSGGYGASLTADLARWVHAVHGTDWAFGEEEVALFTDFLLEGQQWAVHGGGFDFTTMGREITRAPAHRAWPVLRPVLAKLLALGAPRRAELAAFDARLAAAEAAADGAGAGAAPPPLTGTRYYPRSDYLVHRRPAWSLTVRMSSTRTAPTESMNGENLRGRHLGDGVAAIRLGDEPEDGYRGVIPLWDWARLPGVTAELPPSPEALFPRPNGTHGASPDVAGWTDGRHGIAVMRLAGTDRFEDGWKAWFCFEDAFVALGACISAPEAEHPVATTVDQRLAVGPPLVEGRRYAHHGRIGYVPLGEQDPVRAAVERRTGRWSDLTTTGSAEPLSAEVFTFGFDHGHRPEGAAYACLVLPDTDAAATAERAAAPGFTVLSNDAAAQSVRCERTGVTLTARHDGRQVVLGKEG